MHGLYQRLSGEPTLMFSTLHEDDAYTHRFNKGADNKPKLKNLMRRAIKKVDALLMTFFQLGQSGQVDANTLVVDVSVNMSKRHQMLSEQLGLHQRTASDRTVLSHDDYAEMFQAWTWMATRPGASLLGFSRCLFRESYPYASDIYARLSGNEVAFRRLERYLIENGYTRMDNWDGTLTLDYYKTHGDKTPTKGGFQYGIRHTGISASYDILMDSPPVFGLCIPRMKEILTAFDSMATTLVYASRQGEADKAWQVFSALGGLRASSNAGAMPRASNSRGKASRASRARLMRASIGPS